MRFGYVEEGKGVGFRRENISSVDLVKVTYNSMIVLIGNWDLQMIISKTSRCVAFLAALYVMALHSFIVGLRKYNLLMVALVGTCKLCTFFP